MRAAVGERFQLCCCFVSGNGISLLTSAFLFGLITGIQYTFALAVGSVALQADCVSMGVDSLAFLGNLFADCFPKESDKKRRVELGMSGISHILLLAFTIEFVLGGAWRPFSSSTTERTCFLVNCGVDPSSPQQSETRK